METTLREEKINYASRLVETFSGVHIPTNKPIIGEHVFTQCAGVHADGDSKKNLYCNDLLPERFGRVREYALGKTSGKANIRKNLESLGIDIDENSMRKVTERIIELGDKKEMGVGHFTGSSELITVPKSSFKQSPSSGVEACFGSFKAGDELLLKTAISYVSEENARENIERECKHWDFDQVKSASERIWNEWLGKIDVQGGSFQQKTKF